MKIREWIASNSSLLQGIAAIVLALSILLPALAFFWQAFRSPNLVLQVTWKDNTVPPGLLEWGRNLGRAAVALPEPPAPRAGQSFVESMATSSYKELQQLVDSRFGKRLIVDFSKLGVSSDIVARISSTYLADEVHRLTLDIANTGDEPIQDVVLNVSGVIRLLDINIAAAFLTEDGIEKLEDEILSRAVEKLSAREGLFEFRTDVAIHALPEIPAKSSFVIELYGIIASSSRGELTAPGAASRVLREITVEEGSLAYFLFGEPSLLFPALGVLLALFLLSATVLGGIIAGKTKPTMLYELAGNEAKEGRDANAIVLLQKAFDVGFTDKSKAKQDKNLESLYEREDFKKLVEGD